MRGDRACTPLRVAQGHLSPEECGVTVEPLGAEYDSWDAWLADYALQIRKHADEEGTQSLALTLDGNGHELLMLGGARPEYFANGPENRISSVVIILGGPDGLKPDAQAKFDRIFSSTLHKFIRVCLPGGKQHSNVVLADMFMAHERRSLLPAIEHLLRWGPQDYSRWREAVLTLLGELQNPSLRPDDAFFTLQSLTNQASGKATTAKAPVKEYPPSNAGTSSKPFVAETVPYYRSQIPADKASMKPVREPNALQSVVAEMRQQPSRGQAEVFESNALQEIVAGMRKQPSGFESEAKAKAADVETAQKKASGSAPEPNASNAPKAAARTSPAGAASEQKTSSASKPAPKASATGASSDPRASAASTKVAPTAAASGTGKRIPGLAPEEVPETARKIPGLPPQESEDSKSKRAQKRERTALNRLAQKA